MDSNQTTFVRVLSDAPENYYSLIASEPFPTVLIPTKSRLTKLLSQLGDVEIDWEETPDGYKVWAVKKADGFEPSDPEKVSVKAKVAAFDQLHKMALAHFHDSMGGGYADDDDPHYMYEAVMKLTLAAMGDDKLMWKAMR